MKKWFIAAGLLFWGGTIFALPQCRNISISLWAERDIMPVQFVVANPEGEKCGQTSDSLKCPRIEKS